MKCQIHKSDAHTYTNTHTRRAREMLLRDMMHRYSLSDIDDAGAHSVAKWKACANQSIE